MEFFYNSVLKELWRCPWITPWEHHSFIRVTCFWKPWVRACGWKDTWLFYNKTKFAGMSLPQPLKFPSNYRHLLIGKNTCKESYREHCRDAGYQWYTWICAFVSYPRLTACTCLCLPNEIPFKLIHYKGKSETDWCFLRKAQLKWNSATVLQLQDGEIKCDFVTVIANTG